MQKRNALFFFIFTVFHLIPGGSHDFLTSKLTHSIRSPCYCGHAAANLPCLRVLLLVCSFSWSFFETLLSRPPALCVCVRVRVLGSDTSTHPSPFFSIILDSQPSRENPGMSQSSSTGCFGPAPSPLWFTVRKFSICCIFFIYCMRILYVSCFCSLLF